MLQLHYPSFDQSMMMGSQLERSQEAFHRSHSTFNAAISSSEPRYSGNPSLKYTSPQSSISSDDPSPASSDVPLPSPDTPKQTTTTATTTTTTSSTSTTTTTSTTTPAVSTKSPTPLPVISSSAPTTAHSSPSRQRRTSSLHNSPPAPLVKLNDLSQVLEIVEKESPQLPANPDEMRYDISALPVADIIEMVASLLTKITSTNDLNHVQRNIPEASSASSVLAFHGKNVPSISIHSYLSRIHKYCPTTYEVFISLLVYFDRMTKIVNTGPTQGFRMQGSRPASTTPENCFVVDSFNIHRLVIAGVTCASKFFSDVFYTNSRYAKVGGLPLPELNHLELQFLLLNDFRLSIPVEELEDYGTMLVQFYAREKNLPKDLNSAG